MSTTLANSHVAVEPALAELGHARAVSASPAWRRRHYVLVAGIGLLVGIRRATSPLPDTDVLWSSRFGMDFLSSGRLDRVDTFSWTAHGKPWIANSWAWNVVLGGAYKAAGVLGIWFVAIALCVAFGLALGHACAVVGARPVPSAMAIGGLGFLVVLVAPRAAAVSCLMLLVFPALLPALLSGSRPTAVRVGGSLVGLEVFWMNLHASAVLAPAVVLVGGAGLAIGRRLRGPISDVVSHASR